MAAVAAEKEHWVSGKQRDFLNYDCFYLQIAFEVQLPTLAQILLNEPSKNVSTCTEEIRAGSFLKQRKSLAIQVEKAACALGLIKKKTKTEKFLLRAKGKKRSLL